VRLLQLRLLRIPPFGDVSLPFAGEDGTPRALTVLFGGGGVGKTTLIGIIASTRPGHAVALGPGGTEPGGAVSHWILGDDDADRPHPLRVATPTLRVDAEEASELLRRKEQAHFERVAKDGGFALVTIPSTRWFSRQAITLAAPSRTVARYDVRAPAALDDASRTDLTRETKQALAYAAITAALSRDRGGAGFLRLGEAMAHTVDALAALTGFSYAGVDPGTLEPSFKAEDGQLLTFDALPTRTRHLVAFGALPVRALWGAYPGRDPRESEGVVCIDEIDLGQDAGVQGSILACLRRVLPRVQWIVTTASPIVAASAESHEVLALRRLPRSAEVQLFVGAEARVH
jgi:hypothetical protein